MTKQMREEFEAWMATQRNGLLKYSTMYSTARRGNGYVDSITNMLWESWQAARRAEPERKVEPVAGVSLPELRELIDRAYEAGMGDYSDMDTAKARDRRRERYVEDVMFEYEAPKEQSDE